MEATTTTVPKLFEFDQFCLPQSDEKSEGKKGSVARSQARRYCEDRGKRQTGKEQRLPACRVGKFGKQQSAHQSTWRNTAKQI